MSGLVSLISGLVLLQYTSCCPRECVCDPGRGAVDCRGRGLYDVPQDLREDTLELHLQNNRLRGLSSTSLRDTPQLQLLDLTDNSITTLSPSSLLGLRSLRTLRLANNSIRELDRRLLLSVRNLTALDLSHNSIAALPAALADSLHQLTHLWLHHNRLSKLERTHLDALGNLKLLHLRGNPWRCDCHLIGLKLWLETFTFKGGVVDSVFCAQPHTMLERDLRNVPYELFHACLVSSYSYLFANIHYLDGKRSHTSSRSPPGSDVVPQAESTLPECEAKQRPRPANYRHALATVVITGVVCGIVCLMMLAAAVYGCAYAAITAKYQRELKKKAKEAGEERKNVEGDEEKEGLE